MSGTSIILPRQTLTVDSTPGGPLAANDQVGTELVVPTLGLYLVRMSAALITAHAAPRAVAVIYRQSLPTPAVEFVLAVMQVGQGPSIFEGRIVGRESVSGLLQDNIFFRTATATLAGENWRIIHTLQLLGTILEAPQERVAQVKLELVHELKLAL